MDKERYKINFYKGEIIVNFTRKFKHSKILIILAFFIAFSPINAFGQVDSESLELEDLLPQYNNFTWTYNGFAEYGHDMEINNIVVDEMDTRYNIEGTVHDMSGGESDTDYSLNIEYIIEPDVIVQNKVEEAMLDSKYDEIELIRTPLEEDNTWYQEVEDSEGTFTTLKSTITNVEDTDEGTVFTVRYEDINSDYYEQREIKEGVGVISFERIMFNEDTSYEMGYSINNEHSGVDIDLSFQDISNDQWFSDYVSKLITLDLIDGYPDQTFRPNGEITVAEFIKITVESLSYYPEGDSDLWFDIYVEKAAELGLIEEGEFVDYNRPISREEMTKIIVNAVGEEPQSGQLEFSDANEIDSEYLPYIYTAVELDIIKGYPDNSFGANQTTTRAEASKLFTILVEQRVNIEEFNKEDAAALEVDFENRLFQETEEDSWAVKDFDEKEELIEYFSEIMDRELAETYVDDYYEYMDGELTLPPRDGPVLIIEDRDFYLEMINMREYQVIQETETELHGQYTLTITYKYENGDWIMKDRDVE